MSQGTDINMVREIMAEFAQLTGLTSENPPQRYLWTDALAVCNYLGLYRQSGKERHKTLALALVDQVHQVLGRHRPDDPRTGWISGLDEQEGQAHPTVGGLRIGKKHNERGPDAPYDPRREWHRDGQYYHYLTKWMYALDRVGQVTGDETYHRWAVALAQTAHERFTYTPAGGGQKRMYWKMSIDLSRSLVPSMGQHDPLDGWITYHELQASAPEDQDSNLDLAEEIADMARICQGRNWATDDPLGIGGLLTEAYRVGRLTTSGILQGSDLLQELLDAAALSLGAYASQYTKKLPVAHRLAFRELGLSIGLHALQRLQTLLSDEAKAERFDGAAPLRSRVERLSPYLPLREEIEVFWLGREHRASKSWIDHREINMVMLATSLAPDGYLEM